MSNTSKKHRNKKIRTAVIIALVIILVGSFIISRKGQKFDPEVIASIEVTDPAAHLKGNPESELVLVEYSDFQCPACKNAAPQINNLVETFGDNFQLEYRHFPLVRIHPNATTAAHATEAAGMQGKFWEMHDMIFEKQDEWSQSFNPTRFFKQYATEIGINAERLAYDMESDIVGNRVKEHAQQAQDLQLPGTPAFVLDGEIIDITTFVEEKLGVMVAQEAPAESTETTTPEPAQE